MGPGEGLHLRDFLDRVSLLHAGILMYAMQPTFQNYIYIHARASVLYFDLIFLAPLVIFRQLAPTLHDPRSSQLDSSITILH